MVPTSSTRLGGGIPITLGVGAITAIASAIAPQALVSLEAAVDATIEIERWIGPSSKHPGPNVTYCR